MSELLITFDKESPSVIDEKINIKVISEEDNSVESKCAVHEHQQTF